MNPHLKNIGQWEELSHMIMENEQGFETTWPDILELLNDSNDEEVLYAKLLDQHE